jgi:hypothetical protein
MRVPECRVVLRERGPLETLDLCVALVREGSGVLARVWLPIASLAWVTAEAVGWLAGARWAGWLLLVLLSPLMQAPFTWVGAGLMFEPAAGAPAPSLRAWLLARWREVAALLVLWWVGLFTMLVSFGLMAPVVWAGLMFSGETLLLEGVEPRHALRRGVSLFAEAFGQALAGSVLVWAAVLWLWLVAEAVGLQLGGGVVFSEGSSWVDATPWSLLAALLAQPLLALHRLLMYVDARSRVEGWDLHYAIRSLGERS